MGNKRCQKKALSKRGSAAEERRWCRGSGAPPALQGVVWFHPYGESLNRYICQNEAAVIQTPSASPAPAIFSSHKDARLDRINGIHLINSCTRCCGIELSHIMGDMLCVKMLYPQRGVSILILGCFFALKASTLLDPELQLQSLGIRWCLAC